MIFTYLEKIVTILSIWFANNRALGGLITFFVMRILADLVSSVGVFNVINDRKRLLVLYVSAIMIAHQADYMFVNNMFDWQYQSRFLVTLCLAGREGAKLLDYIAKEGIDIPILRYRFKKMMEIEADNESVEEIRRLAAELRSLRENRSTSISQQPPSSDAASDPTI